MLSYHIGLTVLHVWIKMAEKELGTFGPAIDAKKFFTNPVYYKDGIDTVSSKEYSRYVSVLMDRLGYSYEMIKYRQQKHAECDGLINRHGNLAWTCVTTGGRAEGTTLLCESDIDRMYIIKDVICADNPQQFSHQENITLFQTEIQGTSPGYTRLKLLRFDGKLYEEEIRASLFTDEAGSRYLSSQFFTDTMSTVSRQPLSNVGFTTEATSGPSIPASDGHLNHDRVWCFTCLCPDILERWIFRHRSQGWPSPETVQKISLLYGHVAPVGFKGSQNMYREWRICYSLAELYLMQDLNETQLKVYILLKKISKSVLNRICKDMTSYIMKNIILWGCETYGLGGFTQDLIMDRLFDCIQCLKRCVCGNNLPSYMIQERNLLAGRINDQQQQQLISVLDDLLQEKRRMLLRCDKLRDAMTVMYNTPNMLIERSEKRDEVERLLLMKMRITKEKYRPELSAEELHQLTSQNEEYREVDTRIAHLIQVDGRALRQLGKTDDEIDDLWNTKVKQLVS